MNTKFWSENTKGSNHMQYLGVHEEDNI